MSTTQTRGRGAQIKIWVLVLLFPAIVLGAEGSRTARFAAYFGKVQEDSMAVYTLMVPPSDGPRVVNVTSTPTGYSSVKTVTIESGAIFAFDRTVTAESLVEVFLIACQLPGDMLAVGGTAHGGQGGQLLVPFRAVSQAFTVITGHSNAAPSFLAVVATSVGTTVKLIFRQEVTLGSTTSAFHVVALTAGESLPIETGFDLSGTEVKSNASVALFAGAAGLHKDSHGHLFVSGLILEQMFPATHWGRHYVVMKRDDGTSGNDVIKVVALYSKTVVTLDTGGNYILAHKGDTVEIRLSTAITVVLTSSLPVAAVRVLTAFSSTLPDICMTTLVPTTRWRTSYDILLPNTGTVRQLSVITHALNKDSVRHQHRLLTLEELSHDAGLWGVTVDVQPGVHTITCRDVTMGRECHLAAYWLVHDDYAVVCAPLGVAEVEYSLEDVLPQAVSTTSVADVPMTETVATTEIPALSSHLVTWPLETHLPSSLTLSPVTISGATTLPFQESTISWFDKPQSSPSAVLDVTHSFETLYTLTPLGISIATPALMFDYDDEDVDSFSSALLSISASWETEPWVSELPIPADQIQSGSTGSLALSNTFWTQRRQSLSSLTLDANADQLSAVTYSSMTSSQPREALILSTLPFSGSRDEGDTISVLPVTKPSFEPPSTTLPAFDEEFPGASLTEVDWKGTTEAPVTILSSRDGQMKTPAFSKVTFDSRSATVPLSPTAIAPESSSTPSPRPSRLCQCRLACRSDKFKDNAKVAKTLVRPDLLVVNKSTTSAAFRRRFSIPDSRTNSKVIGGIAIVVLVVVAAVIVIPDIPRIVRHFRPLPRDPKMASLKRLD